MEKNEIINCYGVSTKRFDKFIECGVIDKKQEYTDHDIQKLSLALSLQTIGFDICNITKYFLLFKNKDENMPELLNMLQDHRKSILHQIHKDEKKISILDYIIHDLRRDDDEKND